MNNDVAKFDIPIVLFTFKRYDTVLRILNVIKKINPSKLYLFSDGARNDEENKLVVKAREIIEKAIDWDVELIKIYFNDNQGVYKQIGLGAKKVLEIEKMAIFLEDDNLPSLSFFQYCKELLIKYKKDTRILWICGTNYLEKFHDEEENSYVFTQHLMPCGWASWYEKFNKYYDGEIEYILNKNVVKNMKKEYTNKKLFKQQYRSAKTEQVRKEKGLNFRSWDFQMALSIRANHLYGISPSVNLIENIGVDIHSEHGGTSFKNIMTKRFCGIKKQELHFPLKHPQVVLSNINYEKKVDKIILEPFLYRLKYGIFNTIKRILKILKIEGILKLRKKNKK